LVLFFEIQHPLLHLAHRLLEVCRYIGIVEHGVESAALPDTTTSAFSEPSLIFQCTDSLVKPTKLLAARQCLARLLAK
jgi:hypothetical protein